MQIRLFQCSKWILKLWNCSTMSRLRKQIVYWSIRKPTYFEWNRGHCIIFSTSPFPISVLHDFYWLILAWLHNEYWRTLKKVWFTSFFPVLHCQNTDRKGTPWSSFRSRLSTHTRCMLAKSLQLSLNLCDPMVYSLPGSFVHGFPRQEYWSEWPCPPPGDLPDPGIELASDRFTLIGFSNNI